MGGIHGVAQPCGRGRAGARSISLIFRHGTFDVSWNDNGLDEVKDARNKAFKVTATEIRPGNGLILRLADGGTIKIPSSGGIDAWGWVQTLFALTCKGLNLVFVSIQTVFVWSSRLNGVQ